MTHDQILRPNLIIHLDAPTDVIQSKIRERSKTTHPWEANSPVWENTDYVEHLYGQLMKMQYLKTASESSEVLSYDWSEGGDVEVVVEVIISLNFNGDHQFSARSFKKVKIFRSHHGSVQVPQAQGDEPILFRAQGECVRALHGVLSLLLRGPVLPAVAAGQ